MNILTQVLGIGIPPEANISPQSVNMIMKWLKVGLFLMKKRVK